MQQVTFYIATTDLSEYFVKTSNFRNCEIFIRYTICFSSVFDEKYSIFKGSRNDVIQTVANLKLGKIETVVGLWTSWVHKPSFYKMLIKSAL